MDPQTVVINKLEYYSVIIKGVSYPACMALSWVLRRRGYVVCDSIYMTFWKRRKYRQVIELVDRLVSAARRFSGTGRFE